MPEKTLSSYIPSARPDLIKEWHPTKNGNSNPRNMTWDDEEQVWWLCQNGHEWEDTLKCRMAGDRCPFCGPESLKEQSQKSEDYPRNQQVKSIRGHFSEKANNLFQQNFDNHNAGIEFRKYKRYKCTRTAMLEDLFSEIRVYARMQNISSQGMCFESSALLKPGGRIRVIFDKPYFKSKSKNYRSAVTTVRWCKKLTDENGYFYAYGLGLQLN
jgi:hypothetical protein